MLKRKEIERIVMCRPAVEAGEKLGFLPGDLQNKVDPYLRPLYDALDELLGHDTVQRYIENRTIEIAPLAYMRGRTLKNAGCLIDECQNMNQAQAFGIATRVGVGSKVILAGDPEQIDTPDLDERNNGLSFVSEMMRGSPLCAQITFSAEECVRSPLALEAIQRLKTN